MPELAAQKALEAKLHCEHPGCRALIERGIGGVFRVGQDGRIRECNPALARMLGCSSPEEVLSRPGWECDAGNGVENLGAFLLRNAGAPQIELRLTRADGSPAWLVAAVATVEQDCEGVSVRATAVDVTELRRARRQLDRMLRVCAMVSELHRAVADGADRLQLFKEACRAAVELGGYRRAAVALFDSDSGALVPAAQAVAGDGFPATAPSGRECPAIDKLREGQPYVCQDIAQAPEMESFRADAERCGLRSVAALPLHAGGAVAGGFWVFSAEPGTFDPETVGALKEFAFHIAFQIEAGGNAALASAHSRAEARFRELLEAAPDAIIETDRSGAIVLLNAAAEGMFGYGREELLGRSIDILVPERRRSMHARNRDAYVAAPRNQTIGPAAAVCGRRKDGSEFPVEINLCPVRSQSGELVTCIVRDVTHRQIAEQAALESTRQIANILESITDGFFALDRDWRFSYLNRKAEQLFAKTREHLIGRVIWEEFPALSGSVFSDEYHKAMADKAPVEFCAIFEPAGIWAEIHAYPSENGLSVYFQDITDRKHLEDQFQQSQKLEALGRLAGGVAHDFNNLLTIIGGYGQMIMDSVPARDPVRKDVATIVEAANRASALTRQLLAFSRRQMVQPKLLDLNTAVEKMNKMLRRLIREDIELVLALQPGLGLVKIDPGQLEQVLMNLAVNARDAMPTGGTLTIATYPALVRENVHGTGPALPPGRYVALSVADTGTGMDTAVLSRIFEPFFTTKSKHKGTGLGLSTVYGIVKQNGGDILVDTEPGKGTTFRIFLPREERPADAGRTKRKARRSQRGTETILLVEDEPEVRRLARNMLRELGYKVIEAANGLEALRICQDGRIAVDLLFTDVIMPQMSGPQLAEKLTAERPGLTVLYTSGYTDEVVARHGIADCEDVLLQKPFTRKALAAKVRKALDSRQSD
jgi:two-component system cell cycle sensor histidine kinase/response regulator CckA